MERITVNEAAKRLRISNEAVRKRLQRGTIPHGKLADGSVYVCLDPEDYPHGEDAASASWSANLWKGIKENATLTGAVLTLYGVLITQMFATWQAGQDRLASAEMEDRRAKQTAEVEAQRAQDSALQTYLADMGDLLLEYDLRSAKQDSEVGQLARAKTLTVSLRLDPELKSILLVFLNEQALIKGTSGFGPVVNLQRADLSGADLADMDLSYTDLSGTNLSYADLRDGPDYPDRSTGTILTGARLEGVNLTGAKLDGVNLEDANLTGAVGVTNGQLIEQAESLDGAILPNGQRYDEDFLEN
jgi:Pentapeptide repeats (8 copies)